MGVEWVEELRLEPEWDLLKAEGLGTDRLEQLMDAEAAEKLVLVLVGNPAVDLVERLVEEVGVEEAAEVVGPEEDLERALQLEVESAVQGRLEEGIGVEQALEYSFVGLAGRGWVPGMGSVLAAVRDR